MSLLLLLIASAAAPCTSITTLGINLGNTLEEPLEVKQIAEEKFFAAYKSAGFGLVRIPVRWDNQTQQTPPYTIDPLWLERVQTVAGWATSRGMRAIVNSHDDRWLDVADEVVFAAQLPRFLAIWSQISTAFAQFSPLLSFEPYNEPHVMTLASLNQMQVAVHNIIRATSPTRTVVVCGLAMDGPWWINGKASAGLVLPTLADGSADPHLTLQTHNYDPFPFASPPFSIYSWGTPGDIAKVTATFANLTAWAQARRPPPAPPLPIILGEFAVSHLQPNASARLLWYRVYAQAVRKAGFDDNGWFMTLNRTAMTWVEQVLAAVKG